MNIMDMVKGAVSKQVMGQLGGMLGTDEKQTSSAIDIGASTILGGLINKASSSKEGAQQVFDMAKNTDASVLDKLGDILGGGGEKLEAVQASGGGILEGILGGSGQNSMIQMVSKYLGIDESTMGKLLTMLAPITIGTISKYISSSGMDANGLSSLLADQKQHLAGSLPGPLADSLGLGNLMSNVSGVGDTVIEKTEAIKNVASDTANEITSGASDATVAVTEAVATGLGAIRYVIPLVVLAAVAYLGWSYINSAPNELNEQAKNVVSNIKPIDFNLDSLDFSPLGETGRKLKQGFGDITTGFDGLKDSGNDGANQLKGTIEQFTGSIAGMGLDQITDVRKVAARGIIEKFVNYIKAMLGDQNDQIKGILKPAVDALLEKLTAFTG